MQLYYLVNTWFNLWFDYFPKGYIVHIIFYTSMLVVTMLFVGRLNLNSLGIKFVNSWWRHVLTSLIFALFHYAVRILFIEGTFDRTYPIQVELYIPAFIFLGLLMGLSEESAFRGYILKNILESLSDTDIRPSYKPLVAILLSSILFGVYHIYFVAEPTPALLVSWWTLYVSQALTAGIFMGFLYFDGGFNLLGPITYHSTIILLGQIIPWTPLSSPSSQLIVATIVNIVQTLVLKIPALVKRARPLGSRLSRLHQVRGE